MQAHTYLLGFSAASLGANASSGQPLAAPAFPFKAASNRKEYETEYIENVLKIRNRNDALRILESFYRSLLSVSVPSTYNLLLRPDTGDATVFTESRDMGFLAIPLNYFRRVDAAKQVLGVENFTVLTIAKEAYPTAVLAHKLEANGYTSEDYPYAIGDLDAISDLGEIRSNLRDLIQEEKERTKIMLATGTKLSTGTKVGIGLGVAVLGIGAFVLLRRR